MDRNPKLEAVLAIARLFVVVGLLAVASSYLRCSLYDVQIPIPWDTAGCK